MKRSGDTIAGPFFIIIRRKVKVYSFANARIFQMGKRIFLIDGLGALLTAVLLSQVLGRFTDFFGVNQSILYLLALIALAFAIYSFTNHFLKNQLRIWKRNLRIIAIANVIYCVTTVVFLFYLYDQLTVYAWIYFLGEITIILLLARWEFTIAVRS